jgi:hypothetical protein
MKVLPRSPILRAVLPTQVGLASFVLLNGWHGLSWQMAAGISVVVMLVMARLVTR